MPFWCGYWGGFALVVPPPVFGLVFLTGVGIPLAMVAAALWVVLLLLGYLLGALFLAGVATLAITAPGWRRPASSSCARPAPRARRCA